VRVRLLLLVAAVVLAGATRLLADISEPAAGLREPGWHSLDVWRQPQGLPQNSVITLIQTRDGYIWVGTRGGVARFDGTRFTVFDDANRGQLRENEVWALAEEDTGPPAPSDHSPVWIATYGGGVSRYAAGRFTVFTKKEGLIDDYATALCSDRHGGMWIGTDRGLSVYRDGRFQGLTTADGLASNIVRYVFRDEDGSFWIGSDKGALSVWRDGRIERPSFTGAMPHSAITWMHRDGVGALWVAASDGLYRIRETRSERFGTEEGLSGNRVRRVLDGPGGSLWILTIAGLDRIAQPEGEKVRIEHVLTLPSLSSALTDHEGSLWIGSLSAGLTRLRQGDFISYTRAEGFTDDYVSTVLEDRRGNVWVGTGSGLMRFANGRLAAVAPPRGASSVSVLSLMEDRDGALWMGTDKGLFTAAVPECASRGCPLGFTAKTADGLPNLNARSLYQDRRGTVWVGLSQEGLVRYGDGRWQRYTTADGLPSNFVRAIREDSDGVLWIGTRGGGLARLKDGAFTVFSEKNGLVNDGIQALHVDVDGVLWIATRQGVSRLEKGTFTTYTIADGLYSNFVYSFLEDGQGWLWMTCAKGIFRVRLSDLRERAAGARRSVTSIAYGFEHGLASTVPVVGHDPASFRTRDGRVWFATVGGLSVTDPSHIQPNHLPPPVHIESARVDGVPVNTSAPLQLPPGRGDLEIHYTGLSFLAPEKMRFKYKLEGYDKDWVDVGNRRVAYYTNIPPREYRFHVMGCNNDGVWNEGGAELAITLAPHFHQTYWFYALCAAGLALLGAATQRLRLRKLQSRERELSARVDESLAQIKVLRGLLPICAACKKIRDDTGYWNQMETYIHAHSQAEFSHSICPDCMAKLYPDYLPKTETG
jgi:ligand-binding sensor domain-containing protein